MLKVLSLFSGIGAFERALKNIGIDFEIVNYCEIDKYASKSYSLIHKIDESFNIGDITKVDPDSIREDIDLITWGFPCTDISISGYQKGFTDQDGNLTRSGLFYEGMRIINAKKPKIAICENVKNLTGNRFKEEFKTVLSSLEEAGYNNYWQILNAKDFGVPQNRERVFIISIRKDVDKEGQYKFPEGFPLTLRLKDVLEKDVPEKYYIPDELVKRIKFLDDRYSNLNDTSKLIKVGNTNPSGKGMNGNVYLEDGLSPTITTNKGEGPRIAVRQIGNCMPTKKRDNPNQGRIYDINGLSPTLTTAQGGGRTPYILINNIEWKEYKDSGYMVSNTGIVKNKDGSIKSTTLDKDGYPRCTCTFSGKTVRMHIHRLVAELFIDNPHNYTTVNHIDGNKQNNNVNNLEWCSPEQNTWHRNYILLKSGNKPFLPKGIFYNKKRHKYEAQIKIDNKSTYLGRFDNAKDAYKCYYDKFIELKGYAPWDEYYYHMFTEESTTENIVENNKYTAAAMRGRYKKDGSIYQNIEISDREYANTITTVQKDSMIYNGFRIRKLTPIECFILMGFNKEDAELLISNKISNTQLYKQSGNSIVVNVLEHIFLELKKQYPQIFNNIKNN